MLVDNINAGKYQETLLVEQLIPTIEELFEDDTSQCIFQQDEAPCHTAKSCMKWFNDNDVTILL